MTAETRAGVGEAPDEGVGASALAVNLRRTAVEVEIPEPHLVVLETVASMQGLVEDNREQQPKTPAPDSPGGHAPHDDGTQFAQDSTENGPGDEQFENLLIHLPPDSLDRLVPVDQIRGGLRPITSSLAVAIDALRSTIPIGRHNHTEESNGHSPSAHHQLRP